MVAFRRGIAAVLTRYSDWSVACFHTRRFVCQFRSPASTRFIITLGKLRGGLGRAPLSHFKFSYQTRGMMPFSSHAYSPCMILFVKLITVVSLLCLLRLRVTADAGQRRSVIDSQT